MYKIYTSTSFIGKSTIYVPTCHSTNDIASVRLKNNDLAEGTVIVTDHQSDGKGQRGNHWDSQPSKNLTCSIIFKPHFLDISQNFYLNIFVSLSIIDLLKSLFPTHFKIKWPNDILYTDQKLCGILIENFIKYSSIANSIVGIGLNINQSSFKDKGATSLIKIFKSEFDINQILSQLALKLEKRYEQLKNLRLADLKSEYYQYLYWFEEQHTFFAGDYFKGTITGINAQGRLKISTQGGEKLFDIKEVKYIN